MYQVAVFDEEHEDDLMDAVNTFFVLHPSLTLCDVKFSTAIAVSEEEQIYCFSAMVIYMDKEEAKQAY